MSNARDIAGEVRELFQLTQSRRKEDVFLSYLFEEGVHSVGRQGPDNWRFKPEILTFILYVFCPHEGVIGDLLSPAGKGGISQPAVSKRLYRAIRMIAERYGCPPAALKQELVDAKRRIIYTRDLDIGRTE